MTRTFSILPGAEAWSAAGEGARARVGIVISHGFTGNPTSTRGLGEALAAKGFATDVVRLPGHGTHWRDMMRTRYADWRAEVEQALNRAVAAHKACVLVGISMGGTIVLDLACARQADVAAVVSINAAVLDREGLVARAAPFLEWILPVVPAKAAGLVKNDIAKGGDERAYAMVPARAGNSMLRELPRIRRDLETLEVPTLVAYSPQDHSVPPESSREVLRLLAGRHAEELVLERSYHLATMDHDFELLVERITELADRVAAV